MIGGWYPKFITKRFTKLTAHPGGLWTNSMAADNGPLKNWGISAVQSFDGLIGVSTVVEEMVDEIDSSISSPTSEYVSVEEVSRLCKQKLRAFRKNSGSGFSAEAGFKGDTKDG